MATEANNLITIQVKPATSCLPGTVGWAQQQLRELTLEVRATNSMNGQQVPGLYVGTKSQKPSTLLAYVGQAKGFGMRCEYVAYPAPSANVSDRIYALAPERTAEKRGLFDYLTPAAYKLVDAFLDEAVEAFREAINHDDDVAEVTVSVAFKA